MDRRSPWPVTVAGIALTYERDATGRLGALRGGGRTYVEERDGVRVFDGRWARVSEGTVDRGFLRRVETPHGAWVEEYRWDAGGFPVHVDGVEVERDGHGRVVACTGGGAEWRYAYAGDHLAVVDGPHGTRYVSRGGDGRPVRVRENGRARDLAYDAAGTRRDLPSPPAAWHRDDLGRLWTVTGPGGEIRATYLWDGFACLGRIDGPPGAPLAAVFSLDPSRTPVRVITPGGTTRIPRDAFGESLLAHAGVPGLHGGAVHGDLVHFRARALDPRTGSYDRPDPCHGRADDPRRARGHRGALPVETAPTGPYAACRYDAVGFVDPTGENTGWIILSDFTWSFVHNLTGWLGMDLTINFWLSLFGAPWGQMAEFFEFEGFSSARTGAFATRRNGVLAGARAFTLQHQIWSDARTFSDLAEVHLFAPAARFEPTLYGTLLRGVPASGAPFLLQGNLDPQAMPGNVPWAWSRSGGRGEAVVPGSSVPYFPSGGLHFDNVYRGVRGPQPCAVTELAPVTTAPVSVALSASSLFADTPSPVAGVDAGDLLLLTDGAGLADIETVAIVAPQGAGSRVRFTDATVTIALTGVRMRGLDPPSAAEAISAGGPANGLSTAGTTLPFAAGDPVRLSQASAPVGAAVIARLESRVQIDGPLPAAMQAPVDVLLATPGPASPAVTLTGNALSGASLPAPGDLVAVTGSGVTLGALVGGTAAAPTLDRTPAELAPLGASVTWQRLATGATLGQAPALDAGATVTYAPSAPRTAPAAGFAVLRGAAPSSVQTARRVAGATYDALVLGSALPGNAASPYQIERFTTKLPDIAGLSLATLVGLTLPSANPLPGLALQLNQLGGPALAAGAVISAANFAGGVATLAAAAGARPNPSQLVVLQDAATSALELAVVATVTDTVRFDRPVTGGLLPDVRMAPLGGAGFFYDAVLNADGTLTALPAAHASAAPAAGAVATPVQMPRFAPGEIVQVIGPGAAAPGRLYTISAVNGTTLTLTGDAALAGGPAGFTVQRMVPVAPPTPNGTPWLGTNGAAGAANTDIAFRVWRPGDPLNRTVAIRSIDPANPGTPPVVVAARVASVQSVQVTFTAAPATVGAAFTITDPTPTVFYAPGFSQSGVDLTLTAPLPGPPPNTPNLIVAVPYGPPATPIAAAGSIGPGTVLCPADPENWEFDRRQSLAEHELTHCVQSAAHGQIYWGIWPLFAHEGIMEAVSDAELPAYSAYADARLETVTATKVLRIPAPGGIDFSQGRTVQISAAGHPAVSVPLGAPARGGGFVVPSDLAIPDGDVRLRRRTDDGTAGTASDVVYNIFRMTSLGGLMTVVGGAVWGGLIFGIGKLAYLMSRRLFGGGQSYPGTIEDAGRAVRMTTPEGQAAVQGFNEIILRGADSSARRDVESAEGALLRLSQAVELSGAVQVVPYKTSDIWDWHDYFQATVPDASRPARIQVAPRGEDRLTLHQFDRVTVGAGARSYRTNVTFVTPEGLADLEKAPPESARAGFRIAKVDENDPIYAADSRMLAEMGVGWLRWFFDPFGQFQYRLHPERNSWQDILARIARYALGTHSWSWPIPGTLFLMNLFDNWAQNGHRSPLEQEASDNSGNLYSPLAKLRGGFSPVGGQFATYRATVGDLARYWHTPLHGGTGNVLDQLGNIILANQFVPAVVIQPTLRDTPGTNLQPFIHVVPNVQGTPGPPNEPNGTVAPANPAIAGQFVPDALVVKAPATPDATAATGPPGFNPSIAGTIPMTATLNQSIGAYIGFTAPGTHRVTVQDGIFQGQQGRDAQQQRAQTLWFDVNAADVTVTIAGAAVAQATPLASVTLVLLQQAVVSVAPDGARRYALTMTRPGGALLAPPAPLTLAAGGAAGAEAVEISRVYTYTPGPAGALGAFDDPVLNEHGVVALPATFHVPVRRFSVQVVAILPLRAAAEPTAATTAAVTPGTPGFLLVPVAVLNPPTAAVAYPGGPTPGIVDPALAPVPEAPTATAAAFLGPSGQVFRFDFADPPEEAAQVTFTVAVTSGAASANLTCGPIAVTPHFRLLHAAGTYAVPRAGSIVLTAEGGVTPASVVVSPAGVTATVAGSNITLAADLAAAPGARTVTCADAANAARTARRTVQVV